MNNYMEVFPFSKSNKDKSMSVSTPFFSPKRKNNNIMFSGLLLGSKKIRQPLIWGVESLRRSQKTSHNFDDCCCSRPLHQKDHGAPSWLLQQVDNAMLHDWCRRLRGINTTSAPRLFFSSPHHLSGVPKHKLATYMEWRAVRVQKR
jgi:hypothetical protein